jgi:hypothetical protein
MPSEKIIDKPIDRPKHEIQDHRGRDEGDQTHIGPGFIPGPVKK